MDVHDKIKKLDEQYGLAWKVEVGEHLKKKFPTEYELALKDVKKLNEAARRDYGFEDPVEKVTIDELANNIGDKADVLFLEYEYVLKKEEPYKRNFDPKNKNLN